MIELYLIETYDIKFKAKLRVLNTKSLKYFGMLFFAILCNFNELYPSLDRFSRFSFEFLKFENSEEMKSKRIRRNASRLFQLEFTSKESLEELMCVGEGIIGIMDDDGADFGLMS